MCHLRSCDYREYFLQCYGAFDTLSSLLPPCVSDQDKAIGVGIHINIFVDKKVLNRTLAIDSPFQTFAVVLIEFIA